MTSIVLGHFNGETTHSWHDGKHPRSYEYSWKLDASRFATPSVNRNEAEVKYPLQAYIEGYPIALHGRNGRDADGNPIKSFGIHGKFDRQGYNWIDVFPVQGEGDDATPFEIPIPGRVRQLDLWVWGSNLNYYMEAYLRDSNGIVHVVRLGDLNFIGWKNIYANVPTNIRQARRIVPNHARLSFVKFRIWTKPSEKVDDFYIYLTQFKIQTDTFETLFDGDELADPDDIQRLWANNQ